jgi:hypothetical protein
MRGYCRLDGKSIRMVDATFLLLLDFFLYAHRHVSAAHRVQQSFAVITTKRDEVKIIAASAARFKCCGIPMDRETRETVGGWHISLLLAIKLERISVFNRR